MITSESCKDINDAITMMNHNTIEFSDAITNLTKSTRNNRTAIDMLEYKVKDVKSTVGFAIVGIGILGYFGYRLYKRVEKLETKIKHLEGTSDAGLYANLNKTHEKGND